MAYLTRKQIEQIIANAPQGTSPEGIVAALRQQGHQLEGYQPSAADIRNDVGANLGSEQGILARARDAVSDFVGTTALGKGIAATINAPRNQALRDDAMAQTQEIQTELIRRIREKRNRGEDTTRLEQALQRLGTDAQQTVEQFNELDDLGVSNRDVIGSAIRTGATIASAGTYGQAARGAQSFERIRNFGQVPRVTQAVRTVPGMLEGARKGAVAGATSGSIFGGLQGLGTGIENEEAGLGDIAAQTVGGAIGGGLAGGAIGGVIGGAMGGYQARVNMRQQLEDLARTKNTPLINRVRQGAQEVIEERPGTPDARVAGYTIDPRTGRVVNDTSAQNVMKITGLDEGDVAVLKAGTTKDKKVALEMLDMADEIADNPATSKRPTELAGKTFMQRVKLLQGKQAEAGTRIDRVAREKLQSESIKTADIYADWVQQLKDQGVTVKGGQLSFKGSNLEDLTGAQKLLQRIHARIHRGKATSNAYVAHNLKRFIDEQVTYGKTAEGLSGVSERLAKGLRRAVDTRLDDTFTDYAAANVDYATARQALDTVEDVIGAKYLGAGEQVTNQRAATVMNRLLNNAPESAVRVLEDVDDAVLKLGGKLDDSVVNQIYFARILEDIYGARKNSLAGRIAQGTNEAVKQYQGIRNLAQSPIGTTVEAAADLVSITPERRAEALRQYVQSLLTK